MLLFWIVGALLVLMLCAGLGAYVAEAKNRPAWEGLLFGLALGPFGVIVVGLLPTLPPPLPPSRQPDPAPRSEPPEPLRIRAEKPPEGVDPGIRW